MAKPKITVDVSDVSVGFNYEYVADGGPQHGWLQMAGQPNFRIPLEQLHAGLRARVLNAVKKAARAHAEENEAAKAARGYK